MAESARFVRSIFAACAIVLSQPQRRGALALPFSAILANFRDCFCQNVGQHQWYPRGAPNNAPDLGAPSLLPRRRQCPWRERIECGHRLGRRPSS